MDWIQLESSFYRALRLSLSQRRCIITFLTLALCGALIVLCWALSYSATPWIALSLCFLPIFISSGILLSLGVLLSRMYTQEARKMNFKLREAIHASMDLLVGISYLSIPFIGAYLLCWVGMGAFFLLKALPWVGEFLSVILSFGPFLLIFCSLVLSLFNLALLFFVAPIATQQIVRKKTLIERVIQLWKGHLLAGILLLLISLIPFLCMTVLLYTSAALTNTSFFVSESSLSTAMQRFFLMIPFVALLSPTVVFFFNFAAESLLCLQPKETGCDLL